MPLRRPLRWALAAVVASTASARGHPLDEYVQATYITLGPDRVTIDLNLTPGVEVADRVLRMVDTNRDGRISEAEGGGYAARVLREVALSIDGRAVPLTLAGGQYPEVARVRRGEGTIRIRVAGAPWSELPGGADAGDHRLDFRNSHQPVRSAYLVNAYLPESPFAITSQHRDWYQKEIRIGYTVGRNGPARRWTGTAAALFAVAAGTGALLWRRRGAGTR